MTTSAAGDNPPGCSLYTKDFVGDYHWWMKSEIARAEAFAAIRRAAEEARMYERDAYWDVTTQADTRKPRPDDPCLMCAEVIRDAIRAAIGSEKT